MLISVTHELLHSETEDDVGTDADGQECGLKMS